jgi:hypothetical protein
MIPDQPGVPLRSSARRARPDLHCPQILQHVQSTGRGTMRRPIVVPDTSGLRGRRLEHFDRSAGQLTAGQTPRRRRGRASTRQVLSRALGRSEHQTRPHHQPAQYGTYALGRVPNNARLIARSLRCACRREPTKDPDDAQLGCATMRCWATKPNQSAFGRGDSAGRAPTCVRTVEHRINSQQ